MRQIERRVGALEQHRQMVEKGGLAGQLKAARNAGARGEERKRTAEEIGETRERAFARHHLQRAHRRDAEGESACETAAMAWLDAHDGDLPGLRARVSAWVKAGGRPIWEWARLLYLESRLDACATEAERRMLEDLDRTVWDARKGFSGASLSNGG